MADIVSLSGTVSDTMGLFLRESGSILPSQWSYCTEILNVPIPILALPVNDVKVLYDNLLELNDKDLKVIGFNDVAQNSHHYEEYEARLLQTAKDNINYLGICIYGPKKKINRLTGSMKMLR